MPDFGAADVMAQRQLHCGFQPGIAGRSPPGRCRPEGRAELRGGI